jgi:hypothetical protein
MVSLVRRRQLRPGTPGKDPSGAVNMVSGQKGESYEEKLLELDLPTLEERRQHADMVQTFKILTGIDRVEHKTWFY